VYKRHRRAFASYYVFNKNPGFIAIVVPAWDESAVIAQMLRSTLERLVWTGASASQGRRSRAPVLQ
jgi:bacteriophage N4 adsorption protein B